MVPQHGGRANTTIANELGTTRGIRLQHDNFTVSFTPDTASKQIESAIDELRSRDAAKMRPAIDEESIDGLKFSECVLKKLAIELLRERLVDFDSIMDLFNKRVKFLTA